MAPENVPLVSLLLSTIQSYSSVDDKKKKNLRNLKKPSRFMAEFKKEYIKYALLSTCIMDYLH